MTSKPDTIKISASHREELSASHADLFVTVKGSSVISGDQALKKAKEVNQLVEALTSLGLSPEAVRLQGVHIETASGTLLKELARRVERDHGRRQRCWHWGFSFEFSEFRPAF